MTCSGSPSCNRKVVRSGSCRWMMVSSALRSDSASRRSRQPHGEGHVVGDQLAFELFQQPQSLLGEGERDRPPVVPRDSREPRPRAVADCCALDADLGGQCRDGRRLEQPAQGEVDIQHGVRAGDDPGGQQRMPAQLEEVVVDADAFQAQDFCPDRGQLLLDRVSRWDVTGGEVGPILIGRGQCPAIDLAVGGERQRVQQHEDTGNHVFGQALLQESTELRWHNGVTAAGHQIGRPVVCRRAGLPAPGRPPLVRTGAAAASPRSRPARSGSPGSSPADRSDPGTRCRHRADTVPGRRTDTAAPRARRGRGRGRTSRAVSSGRFR